jgi:DNA-binding MarR family transcriptional regulator
VFAESGMRQVPFGVLAVIAANPGTNQGAVGRVLGIKRANMVALVNDLMAQALVARAAVDGRAFALHLTEAGHAVLTNALAQIAAHEDRLLARLTPTERARLVALLRRVGAPD